jgi:hypothetical protein
MKKLITGIALLSLVACAQQKKLYKQSGFFIKTADGKYHFESTSDWQLFAPLNNPCDTVYQYSLSPKKPKL